MNPPQLPPGCKPLPDEEKVAALVHAMWIETKLGQGVTSRLSETGEEMMVPYGQLSEPCKDLDRGTVRTVYRAIYVMWEAQHNHLAKQLGAPALHTASTSTETGV